MSFYNIRPSGIPYFNPIWFGTNVGVTSLTNSDNLIHLCYHSYADQADTAGYRLSNFDTNSYEATISGITDNANLPEIN